MGGVVLLQRGNTPNNWSSTSDPTNAFDVGDGVRVGDHWYNTTTGNVWVNVSNAVGAAVWRHIPRILGQSGLNVVLTGTLSETRLASVLVPAGAMGPNGVIRAESVWSNNNSANLKTRFTRFGPADNVSGTSFNGIAQSTNIQHSSCVTISNLNSQTSQFGWFTTGLPGAPGNNSVAGTSGTVDTTAASYVVFTGLLANTSDTMTLQAWFVTLTRPDIT